MNGMKCNVENKAKTKIPVSALCNPSDVFKYITLHVRIQVHVCINSENTALFSVRENPSSAFTRQNKLP